jgi:MFS family permease
MQIVAINWHIYVLTGSAVALGIIGLSRFIPIVLFSLIGGSFADVHNRKHLQFITQTILAALSLILAFTTYLHTINSWVIYIVTILSAVAVSFDTPARQALVPNLVDKKHLPSAMSLNFIMFQSARIAGPALGGFLIGYMGLGAIYAINTVSFGTVIFSLILLKNNGEPVHEGVAPTISLSSMIEGLKFVKSKTLIWSTMILDFFSTFFASATVILPIFAKDILKVGPEGLGVLYAADSVGAVLTGIIMANFSDVKKQGAILLAAVGVFGVATIFFGLSTNFTVSILALAFLGAGDSISTIIRNVIRNLETPDSIRGRMTSINMIFFMGGPQLGEFEAGVLAAFVGAPLSVVIGGVGTLIVVGAVTLFIPAVRRYQNHQG